MKENMEAHATYRDVARDQRQALITSWAQAAFGREEATSLPQRGVRLLEEAIEAYQACGGAEAMAHKLVSYVFSRPRGEIGQELGGVAVTVLALAAAAGLSADEEECREVSRVLSKPIGEFTTRNANKNAAGFKIDAAAKTAPAPNGRAIAVLLHQLASDCARDDKAMTPGTWVYSDRETEIRADGDLVASGGSVGYQNARMTIDDADGTAIAASRNRLPDLVAALTEAETCLGILEDLVAARGLQDEARRKVMVDEIVTILGGGMTARGESIERLVSELRHLRSEQADLRQRVVVLERERDELEAAMKQFVAAANAVDDTKHSGPDRLRGNACCGNAGTRREGGREFCATCGQEVV